ncbi:hypothetical protein [Moorena sp. SIOASIH]|uniref:hypothetical protein n=1 Tax=Moorena sp. SIOASIH TaxID=2607817 RepID=UPI0025DB285A|nr:hypothetical protein [Moorena sp. SIOASIH]
MIIQSSILFCLDAVAHGEGLCAEPASAPLFAPWNGSRSWGGSVCGTCVRTAVCPVETTAVAHGGDPQDRAASPRPRCLPKTALPPLFRSCIAICLNLVRLCIRLAFGPRYGIRVKLV